MSTQFNYQFQAILFIQTVLIQIIQFSIGIVFVYTHLNVKTVLFQVIQFIISNQFGSIWPIDRTITGATTWSDINEGVLRIPQHCSINGTLPSDCFVSYAGH